MSQLIDNLLAVKAEIAAAAAAAGRAENDVQLLVVSKTQAIPLLQELYEHGIRDFGENRIVELEGKVAALPDDIKWHYIGPVQSNKIRRIVKCAAVIHSVDSPEHLEKFDRIAGEEGVSPEILLEVNVSGEASKGGMTPETLPAAAVAAAACRNLRLRGLMTMAPLTAEKDELLDIFSKLAALRDCAAEKCGMALPVLSMGMSGDFPEAIACGATIVRVGSSIFAGVTA